MVANLRNVTRDFARGQTTLETLRRAARTEPVDRRLADRLLALITDWENGPWTASTRARNELRARARLLLPPDPPDPPPAARSKDATTSMYEAGFRGQRRQS